MANLKYILDGNGNKVYPITVANGVVFFKKGTDAEGKETTTQVKLSDYLDSLNTSLTGTNADKADKVKSATNGNFAGLDSNGNLTDSGKKASDFDAAGAASTVETNLKGTDDDTKDSETIKGAKKYADDAVSTALTSLAGALQYKGTVSSTSALPTEGLKTGDTYAVAEAGTYAGQAMEAGDYLIYNGTSWDGINGENQVSNDNTELVIGTAVQVATVDGTTISVKQVEDTTKLECEACGDTTEYADVSGLFTASEATSE